MALKIPQSTTRTTGNTTAQEQQDPSRRFGKVGINVTPRQVVPDLASIKLSGELAEAEALGQASGVLMDIATDMKRRDDELRVIEESNKAEEKRQSYVNELTKLRKEVDLEADNNSWSVDKANEEYNARRQALQEQIKANNQFTNKKVQSRFESGLRRTDLKDDFVTMKNSSDKRIAVIKKSLDEQDFNNVELIKNTDNVMDVVEAITRQNDNIELHGRASVDFNEEMIEARKKDTVENYIGTFLESQLLDNDFDTAASILENLPPEIAQYVDSEKQLKALRSLNDKKEAFIKAEQTKRDAEFSGTLELALTTNENVPTEMDVLARDDISDKKKAAAINALRVHNKAQLTEAKIADEIELNRRRDPGHYTGDTSKKTREEVDIWYSAQVRARQDLIKENPLAAYVDIAKSVTDVGVMPSAFRGQITTLLNSDDPDQVRMGAAMLKTVEDKNPNMVTSGMKMHSKEMMVADMVTYGVPSHEAQDIAKSFSAMDESTKKHKIKEAKELVTDPTEDIEDAIDASPQDWEFIGAPAIPESMKDEYKELYGYFYVAYNGNAELAQKRAQKAVLGTWGRTNLDGSDRMMRKSPEQVYGSGTGDDEWLQEQFEQDVEAIGLDTGDVVVMVNPNTAHSARPSYYFWDKGQAAFVTENGRPLEWRPDRALYFEQLQEQKRLERKEKMETRRKARPRGRGRN